jgi:hypothetical protein
MTNINQAKIKESAMALGVLPPVVIDNTEKRSHVRKLLNGLGFSTESYIHLPMARLESIYNDLLKGMSNDTWGISGADNARRSMCVIDFNTTMSLATVTQEPVKPVKAPVKAESAPISENEAIKALKALLGNQTSVMDYDAVQGMIDKAMSNIKAPLPTEIVIKSDGKETVIPTGLHHKDLPKLIRELKTGNNIMLVGPAGSGKTTLAHQCSEALGVAFYFNGAISSEYKLTGFMDAQGRIVSTAFRKAYENGGLYLFDEIDASMPDALLAFNAALANGHMDFPDGAINRHKDFYCIAAANTFGKGADRVYVGRNQLDAASLDRFAMICIDYDESLERALAGNDNWTDKVQRVRKAVYEHKIRHVISPRASINGAKSLASGASEHDVMEMHIWKGLDADSVKKVKSSM